MADSKELMQAFDEMKKEIAEGSRRMDDNLKTLIHEAVSGAVTSPMKEFEELLHKCEVVLARFEEAWMAGEAAQVSKEICKVEVAANIGKITKFEAAPKLAATDLAEQSRVAAWLEPAKAIREARKVEEAVDVEEAAREKRVTNDGDRYRQNGVIGFYDEEKRLADDGSGYTCQEFIQFCGEEDGTWFWNQATRVPGQLYCEDDNWCSNQAQCVSSGDAPEQKPNEWEHVSVQSNQACYTQDAPETPLSNYATPAEKQAAAESEAKGVIQSIDILMPEKRPRERKQAAQASLSEEADAAVQQQATKVPKEDETIHEAWSPEGVEPTEVQLLDGITKDELFVAAAGTPKEKGQAAGPSAVRAEEARLRAVAEASSFEEMRLVAEEVKRRKDFEESNLKVGHGEAEEEAEAKHRKTGEESILKDGGEGRRKAEEEARLRPTEEQTKIEKVKLQIAEVRWLKAVEESRLKMAIEESRNLEEIRLQAEEAKWRKDAQEANWKAGEEGCRKAEEEASLQSVEQARKFEEMRLGVVEAERRKIADEAMVKSVEVSLVAEFWQVGVSHVVKRALAIGVSREEIDDAFEESVPKEVLVRHIISKQMKALRLQFEEEKKHSENQEAGTMRWEAEETRRRKDSSEADGEYCRKQEVEASLRAAAGIEKMRWEPAETKWRKAFEEARLEKAAEEAGILADMRLQAEEAKWRKDAEENIIEFDRGWSVFEDAIPKRESWGFRVSGERCERIRRDENGG